MYQKISCAAVVNIYFLWCIYDFWKIAYTIMLRRLALWVILLTIRKSGQESANNANISDWLRNSSAKPVICQQFIEEYIEWELLPDRMAAADWNEKCDILLHTENGICCKFIITELPAQFQFIYVNNIWHSYPAPSHQTIMNIPYKSALCKALKRIASRKKLFIIHQDGRPVLLPSARIAGAFSYRCPAAERKFP